MHPLVTKGTLLNHYKQMVKIAKENLYWLDLTKTLH